MYFRIEKELFKVTIRTSCIKTKKIKNTTFAHIFCQAKTKRWLKHLRYMIVTTWSTTWKDKLHMNNETYIVQKISLRDKKLT